MKLLLDKQPFPQYLGKSITLSETEFAQISNPYLEILISVKNQEDEIDHVLDREILEDSVVKRRVGNDGYYYILNYGG